MAWNHTEGKWLELKGRLGEGRRHVQGNALFLAARRKRAGLMACLAPGLMGLGLGLGGCMIVDSPIKGIMGTEVIWGEVAGKAAEADTAKQGKACAESILGLIAHGDASVRAAKENGGITEVSSIDHSARNLFNIVGEWCTLVRGK